MSIRQMKERDLAPMTFIARTGLEFDEAHIVEPLVREKTIGARNFDPDLGLVYEEDGKIIAFAQGSIGKIVEGRQRGHVRLMVVDRAYRNRGIGSALLQELERRLKAKGVGEVTIMDDPFNYFMPGLDFRYTEGFCFLEKHKYAFYRENHNLLCNLDVKAWPHLDQQIEDLKQEDVEIRRARRDDSESIHEFLEENWPGWHTEVQGALDNDPITLYIAKHGGKTIAFSGYQGNNKAINWFGPMGTLPVLRGKGIGGILLRLCLRDLARQGWRTAIIPWVGPVRFYSKMCGSWLDRCFWAYKKQI